MFWQIYKKNNKSANVAPIAFKPVRNRCAKPVARVAVGYSMCSLYS